MKYFAVMALWALVLVPTHAQLYGQWAMPGADDNHSGKKTVVGNLTASHTDGALKWSYSFSGAGRRLPAWRSEPTTPVRTIIACMSGRLTAQTTVGFTAWQ